MKPLEPLHQHYLTVQETHVKAQLRRLRYAAQDAIASALMDAEYFTDAINWADLDCADARLCYDGDGNQSYCVELQEASPDAAQLQTYIRWHLEQLGWGYVEVTTAW